LIVYSYAILCLTTIVKTKSKQKMCCGSILKDYRTKLLRNRVAQEAALLLYTLQEKEYKQAKQRAAETVGVRLLPSNLEVVEELDRIAEETEGQKRRELLLRMRKEAKEVMEFLKMFSPRLVGSVWRGTARKYSDIDIYVFFHDHQQVVQELQKRNIIAKSSEWRSVTKGGLKEESFHFHAVLSSGDDIEVVVRNPDCMGKPERCEIYGDAKTGLTLIQLSKILQDNPLQKFVPI
jgi:predicted nucleotidyltransferase